MHTKAGRHARACVARCPPQLRCCTRPSVAVDSRNTKKTATPSKVITRTDRSGCCTCTLAATSWTQIDMEIRCATLTNSARNASSPDVSVTFGLGRIGTGIRFHAAHAALTSVRASHTTLGNAESMIDVESTMPISSASLSSASLAASSSSCAMAHAIDSVRSPPNADSASPAVGGSPTNVPLDAIGPPAYGRGAGGEWVNHDLPVEHFKGACGEGYSLDQPGHAHPLRLRRLVLGKPRAARNACNAHGISKRRSSVAPRLGYTTGTIFGSLLSSVLEFSGVAPTRAHQLTALRHLVRLLAPAGKDICTVGGADRVHLAAGLFCQRVSSRQGRFLPEMSHATRNPNDFLRRVGGADVAVGATAAVLAAHYIMATTGSDAEGVALGLQRCAGHIDALLRNWPLLHTGRGDDHAQAEALAAETRAIARARAAAVAAASLAKAQGLRREEALRLQFDWMRKAAWPRNEVCNADSHTALIERLLEGPLEPHAAAAVPIAFESSPPPPLEPTPLSALPPGAFMEGSLGDSSGTSVSFSSSASSLGSADGGGAVELSPEAYSMAVESMLQLMTAR